MVETWSVAIAPLLVASASLLVPGFVVLAGGWGLRRLGILLLTPAVSIALLAVAATIAGTLGVPWSFIPVAVVTLATAAVAFVVRRWVERRRGAALAPTTRRAWIAVAGGIAAAAIITAAQVIWALQSPQNISQTFDAIVHLNTVAFAVDTLDASAFHIGATSDIGFYPNAWHAIAALAAVTTGVNIPVAVAATSVAVCAIAWPISCVALAAAFFRERPAALVASAALATGFGAFPMLLLYFGVLYPNLVAYTILPAALALVVEACRGFEVGLPVREWVRTGILFGIVCAGLGLAHPNAFLALFAFGTFMVIGQLLQIAVRARSARVWRRTVIVVAALLAIGAALWRFARTGWDMSRWGPWESTSQAIGEALTLTPRDAPLTVVISVLVVIGLVEIVRHPSRWLIGMPYLIAGFMFVLVAGTPVDFLLREMVTNPWYNDPYRLAALLPVAGIPVATLGAVTVVDWGEALLSRRPMPPIVRIGAAALGLVVVFSVGIGPGVLSVSRDTQAVYATTDTAPLLNADEAALLSRLPNTTPEDALIAGSPWTGTSLAYAFADRDVVEKHVFGSRDADEIYLDEHMKDIDTDPAVCEAVRVLGVDYVLDFGSKNVWNRPDASLDRAGIESLPQSDALELVDSEGQDAKLYEIVGC